MECEIEWNPEWATDQTMLADDQGGPVHDELVLRCKEPAEASEGALLYSRYCASCHQPSGAGTLDDAYPSLFDNTTTGGQHADNLIAAILYGVDRRVDGHHVLMPRFDEQSYVQSLATSEVVTLSNYVLSNFGNPQLEVTSEDVVNARKGGAPSLLAEMANALPIIGGAVLLFLILGGAILYRRKRHPT